MNIKQQLINSMLNNEQPMKYTVTRDNEGTIMGLWEGIARELVKLEDLTKKDPMSYLSESPEAEQDRAEYEAEKLKED